MERNDFIAKVYNEPVINAVITKLRLIEYYDKMNDSWCHFHLMHLSVKGKPVNLLSVDDSWNHNKLYICLLDSGETIKLKKYSTSLLREDLHLDDDDDYLEKDYYQFSKQELERICSASKIQVLGYTDAYSDEDSRGTDVTTDPRVFRAYYALFIDETKFNNPFDGFSAGYYSGGGILKKLFKTMGDQVDYLSYR